MVVKEFFLTFFMKFFYFYPKNLVKIRLLEVDIEAKKPYTPIVTFLLNSNPLTQSFFN